MSADGARMLQSDVPARLDRLPWSAWHRRVVVALGITWSLDGLEASLVANLAPSLMRADTLALRAGEVGLANSAYLLGQVVGALVFGWLTDTRGRKKMFVLTLGLYLLATALGGLSPNLPVFVLFRFLAGAGIGGEYSAINSAIDELVPSRVRGRVDLAINGTYWIGVAAGSALTLLLANPAWVPPQFGWRLAFGLGAVLGLAILLVRRHVPESPRWLLLHGRTHEAERGVDAIEEQVYGARIPPPPEPSRVRIGGRIGLRHLLRTLLQRYPGRSALGASLMIAQAFFYNAIFFSYGMVLERFHQVPAERVGVYMLPFSVGNFLGPLLLGPLFDKLGRRRMIPFTYATAGLLLLITGGLFWGGLLDATTQTMAWCTVFFFASAAASAAYLTVSELFPLELRGLAIAVFYALATLVASVAPWVFGKIVEQGSATRLLVAYAFASFLMLIAAGVARRLGVAAEGKSLEELVG